MEKNIIVVDETGKEYEATYPKRAKGLVKNGRARFIDEHTICLACPPNTELEDKNMSENKATVQNENIPTTDTFAKATKPLTSREIFDKIVELQNQLTRSPYISLSAFAGAISSICEENEDNDDRTNQIVEVSNVYSAREHNYSMILAFYEKAYNEAIAAEKQRNKSN